jgi:hypothetical protein
VHSTVNRPILIPHAQEAVVRNECDSTMDVRVILGATPAKTCSPVPHDQRFTSRHNDRRG